MPVGDPLNCGPACNCQGLNCNCQKTFTVGDVSKSVPAFMPAYLPFPSMGVTVATLDIGGNLTIKVDQPSEPPVREELDRLERALNDAALAMPIKPVRESPEVIASAVVLGFGSDWWFQTNDLTRHEVRDAIAAAIRAERG